MGIGYYNTLASAQVAGTTLTGSASRANLLPAQATITLPANFFAYIGQKLLVRAQGQLGNIVTTPGTLTIDVSMGAVAAFSSGALNMQGAATTALPFWLEIDMTVRSLGSGTATTLMGIGRMTCNALNTSAGGTAPLNTICTLMIPATSPAVGTGFDCTTTQIVTLGGTFSLSNANAITVQEYELISPNWGG